MSNNGDKHEERNSDVMWMSEEEREPSADSYLSETSSQNVVVQRLDLQWFFYDQTFITINR